MVDNIKSIQKNARVKIHSPLLTLKGHSNFLKNNFFLK